MKKILVPILCGIIVIGMLSGCVEPEEETPEEQEEPETGAVYTATVNYLAEENSLSVITPSDLYDLLNNSDASDDPYILSVRKAADYANGHIPGSINIGTYSVFIEENLAKLPTDKQIAVVCYTGHTASMITALLNVNGYDAIALKWGMSGWTTNSTVTAGKNYVTPENSYSTETDVGIIPDEEYTKGEAGTEDLSEAAVTYLTDLEDETKSLAITADDLYTLLNNSDSSDDPFLLSVRKAADYANGHIPGSMNIGDKNVFTEENIVKLPTDKQIVVVCYTGHTACQITALLNINGYDAKALKFGMCGWTADSVANAGKCYNISTIMDYQLATGADPGSWV